MDYRIFNTHEEFITASVQAVRGACSGQGKKYIGLSGGKTPLPVYQRLSSELSPDQAEFFVADERYVPLDAGDSNFGTIRKIFPNTFSIHGVDTTLPLAQAVSGYENIIKTIPDQKFGLIILGLGLDGHTASLFPGDARAQIAQESVLHTINTSAPNPPVRDRITLSFKTILQAKQLLLLVSGREKQAALNELLHGLKSEIEFPAKKLLQHPALTILYCHCEEAKPTKQSRSQGIAEFIPNRSEGPGSQ